MKRILYLALVGTIVSVSGCAEPPVGKKDPSKVANREMWRRDIATLVGTVSFRTAPDGTREIVLQAANNTKKSLWVPSSDGTRGMIACEAVNLSEDDSLLSMHSDHALCRFPEDYMSLSPGKTCEYVYELPDDFRGKITMSVWAPWRTDKGELIDRQTREASLKDGAELIEEVQGIGVFKEEALQQQNAPDKR